MARRTPKTDQQIDMFGAPAPKEPPASEPKLQLAEISDDVRSLAARLPSKLHLGTSSWSFPGWRGIVWDREASEQLLAKEGLAVYARHPLFRGVGLDRTYYAKVSADVFINYAAVVPPDFRFLVKAEEALVMPKFPNQPRYGAQKGLDNPKFLDASYATDVVVAPFVEGLKEKGGPLLFQFPPLQLDKLGGIEAFTERTHRFLTGLPKGPLYAVEVRNSVLITKSFGQMLKDAGAVPALTGWGNLPNVARQAEALGALDAKALVLRWMLAPGHDYEAALDRFEPFSILALPDPTTRELIVRLTKAAIGKERPAYVIVNNKAEGSSPLSLLELAKAYANLE